MAGVSPIAGRTWARANGVTLTSITRDAIEVDPWLRRALADGVKRGIEPDIELPRDVEWYAIREQRRTVGVLAVRRDYPASGAAALLAVAVAPEHRGRAAGTKAVLAAERKLRSEGYAPVRARVPRTNGRGLYFMLRCGFSPLADRPDDAGDATWFGRVGE
jgi:GNAT superfamily N-acetyltransferase